MNRFKIVMANEDFIAICPVDENPLHNNIKFYISMDSLKDVSQESPRVEKPVEIQDVETTNGVVDRDTRIPTTEADNMVSHPDSYNQSKEKSK